MAEKLGFGDLAAEALRRETDLDRITPLLNWGPIAYRLEKHCRREGGRPPFSPLVMFKALLLAQWYQLSDRGLEEALCDRLSFRRFVGLRLEEATPDHTTLCRFRERLREAGLERKLLELINTQLDEGGFLLKRGTLIDATVVQAAARPSGFPATSKDPDAALLKQEGKAGKTFGYKAHIAADQDSLLVREAKMTAANVNETVVADELILACRDAPAVFADKAYDSHARRALLSQLGIANYIMRRGNKHHSASSDDLAHNSAAATIRRRVETVFAVLKRVYGFRRTRYVGLICNQLQLTLLAICFNLRRALAIARHARSPSPA